MVLFRAGEGEGGKEEVSCLSSVTRWSVQVDSPAAISQMVFGLWDQLLPLSKRNVGAV